MVITVKDYRRFRKARAFQERHSIILVGLGCTATRTKE